MREAKRGIQASKEEADKQTSEEYIPKSEPRAAKEPPHHPNADAPRSISEAEEEAKSIPELPPEFFGERKRDLRSARERREEG